MAVSLNGNGTLRLLRYSEGCLRKPSTKQWRSGKTWRKWMLLTAYLRTKKEARESKSPKPLLVQ